MVQKLFNSLTCSLPTEWHLKPLLQLYRVDIRNDAGNPPTHLIIYLVTCLMRVMYTFLTSFEVHGSEALQLTHLFSSY